MQNKASVALLAGLAACFFLGGCSKEKEIRQNVARGCAYFDKGDYPKAIENLSKVLADYPRELPGVKQPSPLYFLRGTAYASLKDLNKAAKDFAFALEIDPDAKDVAKTLGRDQKGLAGAMYGLLGSVNQEAKAYDAAIKYYSKAIEMTPAASLYSLRGYTYLQTKDYGGAIADGTAVIGATPNDASGYHLRGSAYYLQGKYDEAVADCSKEIAAAPRSANGYILCGGAYSGMEEYDMAIGIYTKALALSPNNAGIYSARADVYRKNGDMRRAAEDEKRARELKSAS